MLDLHKQAQKDLKHILNAEFGQELHLVSPLKEKTILRGFTQDIGQRFDQETGLYVEDRLLTVSVSLKDIKEVPTSPNKAPFWFVFIDGKKYKVKKAMPDLTLDIVVLTLEFLENA